MEADRDVYVQVLTNLIKDLDDREVMAGVNRNVSESVSTSCTETVSLCTHARVLANLKVRAMMV